MPAWLKYTLLWIGWIIVAIAMVIYFWVVTPGWGALAITVAAFGLNFLIVSKFALAWYKEVKAKNQADELAINPDAEDIEGDILKRFSS